MSRKKTATTLAILALISCGLPVQSPTAAQVEIEDAAGEDASAIPSAAELEQAGALIGRITFDKQNVFDTSLPSENNALYRLANRWHVVTRDSTIQKQLLFRTGDVFSQRLLEESERLLRQNSWLYDVKITPIRYQDGVVDLRVWTRDLWTLLPGFSISRSGGENRTSIELSESNLVGLGVKVRVRYKEDVDRSSTSFQYFDRNLGQTWWRAFLDFSDASDGDTTHVNFTRPFYALDTRWSAGTIFFDDEREESFYELGNEVAEYKAETDRHSAFWGWSSGLRQGWVTRWTTGIVYDDREFNAVPNGQLPSLVPDDRRLVYPFLGYELLEDDFEKASNRDQIERTEDFFMGARITARLGWASESFGSDRDALVYSMTASKSFGSIQREAFFLSSTLSGRFEGGDSVNTRFGLNARFYNKITDKRLVFVTLEGTWGNDLDIDSLVELGGDTGLRGYPLRYQTGESKVLVTAEQRYFTDWYPFRLFRVGGAVFADIGRTWGENPVGGPPLGWLKDIGVGLRLGSTRSTGRDVVHIDIAFPLDGDPTIDDVQFLIESKRSF
jgi:outer membrane protein assembly factor BamA